MSGEPSHCPPPPPWGYLEGWQVGQSRSCLALGIVPGPCRVGRRVGRGVSPAPVPGGRRLCSPCREEFYSPQDGEVTEKKRCRTSEGCCLQHWRWAGFWVGLARWARLPRLLAQPLQGSQRGEGAGSEGAVEYQKHALPQHTHRAGAGRGSLLHCVIRELGLPGLAEQAPRGSDVTSRDGHHPLSMAPLWARVPAAFSTPSDPRPGQSPVIPLYFTVAQGSGHGVWQI